MDPQTSPPPMNLPLIGQSTTPPLMQPPAPAEQLAGKTDQGVPPYPDAPPPPPLAATPIPKSEPPADNTSPLAAPSVADDVDLIEKEWVQKVKEVIQSTNGDPYERSRQLTLLKTDYLQKRYNKTIKLT